MRRVNAVQYQMLSRMYNLTIISADDQTALVYIGGQKQ